MEKYTGKIRITETFEHPFGALMKGERFNVQIETSLEGEDLAFIKYKTQDNSSISVKIPQDYFEVI